MLKKFLLSALLIVPFVLPACNEDGLNLKIRFDQVQGLKKGDSVIFGQNHIGTVNRVVYTEQGDFLSNVNILNDFAATATEHSRFFIVSDPQNKGHKAIEMIHASEGGAILKNKSVVNGSTQSAVLFQQIFDGIENGLRAFEEQVEQFSKDFKSIPESDEFKKLEDEFNRLTEELRQSGQDARQKIEKELLPQLRKEMERLRKQLQKLGREDETKPHKVKTNDAQKI